MPLPNAIIASAFIESYITIRKSTWKLDVNDRDSIKNPEDPTVKHKITICLALLEEFKKAKTFEDWIKILDEIYARERAEFDAQQNRFAIIRAVTYQPLAGETLHAVRTYLVSELKNEQKFKNFKIELLRQKKDFEKDILWDEKNHTTQTEIDEKQKKLDVINRTLETRNDSDEYYLKFFAETIMIYDTEAKRLDEKTFNDFKANVTNRKRTLVICQRLIEDNARKILETNPAPEIKTQPPVVKDKKEEAPVPVVSTSTSSKQPAAPPLLPTPSAAQIKELQSLSPLLNNSTFQPPLPPRIQPRRVAKIPATETMEYTPSNTRR